jgi:dipeptidyl aminopeptidase/acylaminoacyl peptidase
MFLVSILRVSRQVLRRLGVLLAVLALTSMPGHVAAAQAPLPPLSVFFDYGNLQAARLSPSGRWLAAQTRAEGGRAQMVMVDLQGKEQSRIVAAFKRYDVSNIRWLTDDLLLFDFSDYQDRSGRRRYPGLASVQRDGEGLRVLIKNSFDTLFPQTGRGPLEANNYMLAFGEPGSDEIIVGEVKYGGDYKRKSVLPLVLNARTGARRTLLESQPADLVGWRFDHRGRARLAWSSKDGETVFFWHELETKAWREIARFPWLHADFWPEYVDADGQLYVSVSRGEGGSEELRTFDVATGKIADQPLAATPGFDESLDLITSRKTGRLLGVSALTDARSTVWFVPGMQAVQAKVDAFLRGRVNIISCADCSNPEHVLVYSYSDREAGDFLIYTPATDSWLRAGKARPEVDAERMAGTSFHRIKARDGQDLPVWVTRLADTGRDKAAPAVVLVHGGPWERGRSWEWEAQSQFLASRGYVVIEPEFRGSTGYGDAHYRAGWKQWGQTMQDDVSDAMDFAVKQGWVDPKRVCIAGASYGGYSTLMGLAKEPDRYACGVAWVGVSDPRLMYTAFWSDISDDAKLYTMPEMIGDLDKDAAMLKAHAPVELAARIKSPVLLAYGGKDERVPIEHGEAMRKALIKAGNEPQWILYPDEGHGWSYLKNEYDFWQQVETFLARHLKP